MAMMLFKIGLTIGSMWLAIVIWVFLFNIVFNIDNYESKESILLTRVILVLWVLGAGAIWTLI